MWHTGAHAGFTHPRSLEIMGERQFPRVEAARKWLFNGTKRGQSLTTLVGAGGDRFDDFERALLTFGDETGKLEDALRLLADYYAGKNREIMHVKKQLAYPFFCSLAACFIAPFPLLFFGHPAAYTLSALGAATMVMIAGGAAVAAVAAKYGRKPELVQARMARALAVAVEAGLPLPRALRLAADVSGDEDIRNALKSTKDHDLATSSIRETLSPHVTREFSQMIATAEVTGDFSVLRRMADIYEDRT